MRRPALKRDRRRPAALSIVAAGMCLASCGPGSGPEAPSGSEAAGYRVSVPGALLGRFPPGPTDVRGDTLIEGAFGLAVSNAGIFVLDAMGARIHRLDLEARHVASMGRRGEGPGELVSPISMQIGPDGDVWVSDPRSGRLSRFGADGRHKDERVMPYPVVNFVIPGTGRPVFPSLSGNSLLATLGPAGRAIELPVDRAVVPERVSGGPGDRLSFRVFDLLRSTPDTLLLFRNKHATDFQAWRIALAPGGDSIRDVIPLPLPRWLYTMTEQEVERFRSSVSETLTQGDFFVPFKSARVVDGILWLAPAASGRVIAVSIPAPPADSAEVVLPEGGEYEGMIDAAVVKDRLVALYSTEVRVYQLEAASADRFTPP